jgi:protein-S-isoprenylcysteine O-methyltransferase Ste14
MNDENIYRYFALVVFILTVSISIFYRRRAARSGDRISAAQEEGRLLSFVRSLFGLALWGGALAYLIQPGWMAWGQVELPAWLRWAGGFLMLVCVPLVYWVFSSLGKNVTQTVAIRKEHSLVRNGPYRWVRHPLYSVGLFFFLSFSLLSANWFIILVIVAAFKILSLRTNIEEARLIEKFGDDYRQYMQSTGRYLPKFKHLFGEGRA